MPAERFYTQVEIKSVDAAQRIIEGYAAVFGNLDRVGDIIEKTAFDRTLKESDDVLVFIGHDASRLPVGEPESMRVESKGLFTRTKIYNTTAGDELLEVARQRKASGRSLGMSIGYKTVKQRYADGARHLLDVSLVEYSFLASPSLAANPEATSTAVKRHKAMGVGPVITTDDSYEELRMDLQAAAGVLLGDDYACVCATFADHVIVSSYRNGEMAYWDIPYTLDAAGNPTMGEASAVEPAFVPGSMKARAERDTPKPNTPERKVDVRDLHDGAFAFIEPGTTLDEEKKSVPRAARHLPHHTETGELDETALKAALTDPDLDKHGAAPRAHLMRHAIAAGILMVKSEHDDAHASEWSIGAAPALLALSAKLAGLAQAVAAEQTSMRHLGMDTKNNQRIRAELRQSLEEAESELREVISWATTVDRGEDGAAYVERMKSELALLELESGGLATHG